MPEFQRQGQLIQADYYNNVGGLNNTDSPFIVPDSQASEGRNYEYTKTGGIRKRFGQLVINSSADTELKTYALGLRETAAGVRSTVRVAGQKIQFVNVGAATFTNLSEDTSGASTDFLAANTTTPVAQAPFNTSNASVLWFSGGGMSNLHGAYSDTKVTANGVAAPTGSITATPGGSGSSLPNGTYAYAVLYRKLGTQALSNVALDVTATTTGTQNVTVDVTGLTNLDTTKFDKIYIYRSGAGGAAGFTVGDLIAQIDSTTTSYIDDGTSIADSQNIPRTSNLLLDNSELPADPLNVLTVYKRHLVTAKDSTVYISDLNKPESWPTINQIPLAKGGPITGLGVISFTTPTSTSIDEILVVFQRNRMSVITGDGTITNSIVDWSLKFLDNTGCAAHNSIVGANGYLYWWNERGLQMWDGSGKPLYMSRLIEEFFSIDGDIDKSRLDLVWGQFYEKQNYITWYCSHKIYGEQKYSLKLDLRLTLPMIKASLGERVLDAVFIPDSSDSAIYAGDVQLPRAENEDSFIVGDDTGTLLRLYNGHNDASSGITFEYSTSDLDQGKKGTRKQYVQVIAWVEQIGTWNLTLDYWANYRAADGEKSTRAVAIASESDPSSALWDVAEWDTAFWDDYTEKLVPIVFNLDGAEGNTHGDAIKLKFSQTGADEPVTIYGYSVLYTPVGATR